MSIKGIDVSVHNGKVDWESIDCDFAMLRIGYGNANQDGCLEHNVENCKVPYGMYHFSYAYTVERAEKEAEFVLDILESVRAKPSLPIFYDWEYDSDRYAKEQGVKVDKDLFCKMAVAFMDKLKEAGYKVGIYYNFDYKKNYCNETVLDKAKYYQWLAFYNDTLNDTENYDIWQNSDKGTVTGFKGDTNFLFNEDLIDKDALVVEEKEEEPTLSRVLQTGSNQITCAYGNGHNGIDLVKKRFSYDGIIAHTQGEVVYVQNGYKNAKGTRGMAAFGNMVKIKHPNNYRTVYAHLASVDVEKGDKVSTGQRIGYMGNTGNSYGGHLHFEVRNTSDKRINPKPYINADLPNSTTGKVSVEKVEVSSKYTVGRYEVTADLLNVREGASTDFAKKKHSQLTKNAQEQVLKLAKYEANGYVEGVVCDVSKVKENWGKTSSGWICLDYCKKIG